MKFFLTLVFTLSFSFLVKAQGIEFFDGSFEEALELAEKQDKMIFVDAYTSWCGPCKRMKKYIFPNKLAGDFYNKYFINMAIDMDSQKGKAFNAKYPVRGYPTFLFIDHKGEVIKKDVGGKPIEVFIKMGEVALRLNDKSEDYEVLYNEGKRDYDFMLKYVSSLVRADKASAKIVYDYLNNGPDMSEEEKAKFLFEATCCCDSKLFDMMTDAKIKNILISSLGKEAYESKIYEACWATVEKGMEYNVDDLYEEAKAKYKKEMKKNYSRFEMDVDLAVARRNIDASKYLKVAKKNLKTIEDSNSKNEFLLEMKDIFPKDEKISQYSESYSKKLLNKENNINNNFSYAKILLKNGKNAMAIPFLNKAIKMAEEKNDLVKVREVQQWKTKAIKLSR